MVRLRSLEKSRGYHTEEMEERVGGGGGGDILEKYHPLSV